MESEDKKQELFALSLHELRVELFKRKITLEKAAKILSKHKSTLSHFFNDSHLLSAKYKTRLRKRICTLIVNYDKRENG